MPFFRRLSENDFDQLVGNLEELIGTHRRMNRAIEEEMTSNNLPPRDQRLGRIFLAHGANIKKAHLAYWSNHPKAVAVLEKHRDRLESFMEGR